MYEINFSPGFSRDSYLEKTKKLLVLGAFVFIFTMLFIGLYFPYRTLNSLKCTRMSIDERSLKLDHKVSEKRNFKNDITAVIVNKRAVIGDDIEKVIRSLAEGVNLDDVNFNAGEINIKGKSKDYFSIIKFSTNLNTAFELKSARIIDIEFIKNIIMYSFVIKIEPRR